MDWTHVLVVIALLSAIGGGWFSTKAWRNYSRIVAVIPFVASAVLSVGLLALAQLDQATHVPVYQPCVWLVLFVCGAYASYYHAKRKEEKETQTTYEG